MGESRRQGRSPGLLILAIAAVLALAAGCSSAAPPSQAATTPTAAPPSVPAGAVPTPEHVVVVVFENKDTGQVLGNRDAPYLTALSRTGTVFTDAHAETHPSEPNYLALFSGSTHGVSSDACPLRLSGPTLAGQLLGAGRTFTGWSEGLPRPGWTGCGSDGYARKHVPWVDFPALPATVNQPLSALPADRAALPTVSFVVPDLCSDMHDCSVATGDRWARAHLAGYVGWARTHDSLLIVTFDEDDGSSANHIATFLVGPMVRAGTDGRRIDHYTLLRTVEAMYGLPGIGSAASVAPITGIWTTP